MYLVPAPCCTQGPETTECWGGNARLPLRSAFSRSLPLHPQFWTCPPSRLHTFKIPEIHFRAGGPVRAGVLRGLCGPAEQGHRLTDPRELGAAGQVLLPAGAGAADAGPAAGRSAGLPEPV